MFAKIRKSAAIGLAAVVILAGGAGMAYLSYQLIFWEKVYPGVSVAGVDVGNKSSPEVRLMLSRRVAQNKGVILRWNKTLEKTIAGDDIGWRYDIDKTINESMDVGRKRSIWVNMAEMVRAARGDVKLDVAYDVDEEKVKQVVSGVAGQIDLPVKEPEISVEDSGGTANVSVTPGKNGQVVEDWELTKWIAEAMLFKRSPNIDIPVQVLEPKLSPQQVLGMKDRVAKVFGRKIVLEGEGQKWELTKRKTTGGPLLFCGVYWELLFLPQKARDFKRVLVLLSLRLFWTN